MLKKFGNEVSPDLYKLESPMRCLSSKVGVFFEIIAVCMSLFHLYTGTFGLLVALRQRSMHLLFGLALIFALYPATASGRGKTKIPLMDYCLIGLSLLCTGYVFVFFKDIIGRPNLPTQLDLLSGAILILLVLEAARRTIGVTLPLVAIVFLLYAHLGPYMPGFLGHRGFNLKMIVDHMCLGLEGIYGIPIAVSASFVYLFILFGAFLSKCGLSDAFLNISAALAGKSVGGPAKVAIIASGFMGSISGSSIANVVSTGAFTIPLMKRIGYDKNFAGAVESAASTGGQILPPVMGAAAFIMAEFIGVPYLKICAAAAIPAVLYFSSVLFMVHFRAKKLNLPAMPEVPKVLQVLKTKGFLFLPIVVIVYFLIAGYTPLRASIMAIGTSMIVGIFNKMTFQDVIEACKEAAYSSLSVVAACATAGMIVGVVTLTGLGLKLAHMILLIAGSRLILALFLTMVASIVLGMGLPTTAKYIVLATIAAPALIRLGVLPIAAHLFIFYFGIFADVTPPVAVAAYAAVGISGGDPFKTGFTALKLAVGGFLMPYLFCYNPSLLLLSGSVSDVIMSFFFTLLGIVCFAAAIQGCLLKPLNVIWRLLLFLATFAFCHSGITTSIVGIVILLVALFNQRLSTSTKAVFKKNN